MLSLGKNMSTHKRQGYQSCTPFKHQANQFLASFKKTRKRQLCSSAAPSLLEGITGKKSILASGQCINLALQPTSPNSLSDWSFCQQPPTGQ
jgi:hypothetical protein